MGLSEVLEEVESLRSIFCKDGEFTLHSNIGNIEDGGTFGISYSLAIEIIKEHVSDLCERTMEDECNPCDVLVKDPLVIVLTVVVNEKYPSELEGFSLQAKDVVKRNINEIKVGLDKYIRESLLNNNEEPFIMQVVDWIKDTAKQKISTCTVCTPDWDKRDKKDNRCVVLMLDHMRSKQKYTKLITGWMTELELTGRVLFFKKKIWVVLHGDSENMGEYLKRHKTCNVDVDSNGRPCKERMMNIIIDVNSAVNLER